MQRRAAAYVWLLSLHRVEVHRQISRHGARSSSRLSNDGLGCDRGESREAHSAESAEGFNA